MKSRTADNRRYGTRRALLILLMGSKCTYCPERRPWKLEFHHLTARTWNTRKLHRNKRILDYAREWANGDCVLACGKCNKRLGKPTVEI